MKKLTIQVVRVRYNLLPGIAWIAFWTFLAFFLGVMMSWWTIESETAHLWWVFSAIVITICPPYQTVTVLDIQLPPLDVDNDHTAL